MQGHTVNLDTLFQYVPRGAGYIGNNQAAIDFVDEEIDFLTDGIVENRVVRLLQSIATILGTAAILSF
jgi:hypothetical protein